jgi:hypothetical protein
MQIRMCWCLIAVLSVTANAFHVRELVAADNDTRLEKRIAELEAENLALRKIIAGIQSAIASVPKSSIPNNQDRRALRIVIVPDNWGGSSLADMHKVCVSAAGTIWAQLPDDGFAPIQVQRSNSSPITLFKRGEGSEYIVKLNTASRAWAQCAYQFSHEFCHIVCNYRNVKNNQMWFEETLCECASLFALRRMGVEWQTNPPYSNWKDYSKSLTSYAADRLEKLKGEQSIEEFYKENQKGFEKTATNREINGYIAAKLLPLFEANPAGWQSLRYLNLGPAEKDNASLRSYLTGWHGRVPAKHKPFVAKIAAEFGYQLN